MTLLRTRAGLSCLLVFADAGAARAAGPPSGAQDPFSVQLALTSDYRFRGQSQSDRSSAIQAYIDYLHSSGAFAALWMSRGIAPSKYVLTEIDPTIGYEHDFSTESGATATLSYYWSQGPGPRSDGYFEGTVAYFRKLRRYAVNAELAFSPDYAYRSGPAVGLTGGVEGPLPFVHAEWLSASAHLGYQWLDDHRAYGTPNWFFYDVGLGASWRQFTLELRFVGTSTEDADCFGGTNLCDGGATVTLSTSL